MLTLVFFVCVIMMMIRCGVGCYGSWSIDKFGLLCTKKTSKKILMSLASTRGSSFFVFLAHNYCVAGHVSSTYGTVPYLCKMSRIIRLYNMFVLTMSADDTSTRSLQLWKKKNFSPSHPSSIHEWCGCFTCSRPPDITPKPKVVHKFKGRIYSARGKQSEFLLARMETDACFQTETK